MRPVRQTFWRRKHDIRAGSAPHFYTGAMSPEVTPENEIRVGYRNRIDDPTEAGYEYVGFVYRGFLRFDDLPHAPKAEVVEAWLTLRLDETLWQQHGNPARKLVSVASHYSCSMHRCRRQMVHSSRRPMCTVHCPMKSACWNTARFRCSDGLKIDLKPLVQAWMRGEKSNHGLVLMGPNEDFEHNSDYGETTYGESILTISYRLHK